LPRDIISNELFSFLAIERYRGFEKKGKDEKNNVFIISNFPFFTINFSSSLYSKLSLHTQLLLVGGIYWKKRQRREMQKTKK